MKALAIRVAALESVQWLRYVQGVFAQVLHEAGVEAGVPDTTLTAMEQALRYAHQTYPQPLPGWEHNETQALHLSDTHVTMVLRVLETYLAQTHQCAVRVGMAERLQALAKAQGWRPPEEE